MYEMTIFYKNEEIDVYVVEFGAHDLHQYINEDTNAIIFDDENDVEHVIYQDSIQKITFDDDF